MIHLAGFIGGILVGFVLGACLVWYKYGRDLSHLKDEIDELKDKAKSLEEDLNGRK